MPEDQSTVFIVDDDPSMREMLEWLMSEVGIQTRSFETAKAFLDELRDDTAGCLLLDVRMPGMSGLELQGVLQDRDCPITIIFLTGHGDVPMATMAMSVGAFDFIEKPFNNQRLIEAVHRAVAHSRQTAGAHRQRQEIRAREETLTKREREVFRHLVDGKANKEIAGELGMSERTVETHRRNILGKMKARNAVELVRMAMDCGFATGICGPAPRP